MAAIQKKWTKYFDLKTITKLFQIGFNPSIKVIGNLIGDHKSAFSGFAVEFTGHRGYVPGDEIKHIDWKAYYKTDKYLVKQYEQETNFDGYLIIDISESMKFEYKSGKKIDYAAFIATAIARLITYQSDKAGVYLFDNDIKTVIPATTSEQVVAQIAQQIENSELKDKSAIGRVLSLIAEKIGMRKVIFIISDFFGDPDEMFNGIKRLIHEKHEIVLLQIVDPLEMIFDIPGRVRLLELEGREKMDITGSDIRESYEELFNGFLKDFRKKSFSLGIDYILCDMGKGFGEHLIEYLSKRQLRG